MALTEDNDVVQTLPSYRAHKPFDVGILPRRPGCGDDCLDAEALNPTLEVVTVDTVAVADQVLGRCVLWECLDDLLGGPLCARVAGDVPVDDAPAIVGEDEKDVEDAKGRGWHGEEVDGRHGAHVIVQKSTPGLRWRLAWLGRHESGYASLADVDAEFEQFPVDFGRSPEWIGLGHLADERLGLRGELSWGRSART